MLKKLSFILILTTICAFIYAENSNYSPKDDKDKKNGGCIDCHLEITPGIVRDFFSGVMSKSGVTCDSCHGSDHDNLESPNIYKCMECHVDQYSQFKNGKHSLAWIAMQNLPEVANQPADVINRGCGSCHRIGRNGGMCDSCHTRHRFSKAEARRPEACLPCHAGIEHPQYEMWKSSKHGVIYQSEGGTGRSPTCTTCHMDEGNHEVPSSWKFLGLKLDQKIIEMPGFSEKLLDKENVSGKEEPTNDDSLPVGGTIQNEESEWQASRKKQMVICQKCHSRRYAEQTFLDNENLLKEVDKLMLEAFNIAERLYYEGILERPTSLPTHPDHLEFFEFNSILEKKMYIMFLEHRARTFMGAFHNNPHSTHRYGWILIKRDLAEIKDEAKKLRENYNLQNKMKSSEPMK